MKKIFSYLLMIILIACILPNKGNAQSIISGTIYDGDNNTSLPFASVYFNSTTNGTITDENGDFTIVFDPNYRELVISFLGYESLSYIIDTSQIKRPHKFYLKPSSEVLETVKIKAKRDKTWYDNLAMFKEYFIGNSEFAKKTKIINEESIYFSFDQKTGIFKAFSREPLEIINEELGYKITYSLKEFFYDGRKKLTVFLGYTRFEELKEKPKKKWINNRTKAYNGSFVHFTQALVNNRLPEDGFIVNNLYKSKVSKPSYRTKTIEIDLNKDTLSQSWIEPNTNKRGVAYLDKNPASAFDSLSVHENSFSLTFNNHWQVTYTKEKEDKYYTPPGKLFDRKRKRGHQISVFSLTREQANINAAGLLEDPLDVLLEGYWSHEKLANMLPLDYEPIKQ